MCLNCPCRLFFTDFCLLLLLVCCSFPPLILIMVIDGALYTPTKPMSISITLSLSGLDVSVFHLKHTTHPSIYHIQSNPNAKWLSVLGDEDANKDLR